MTSAMLPGRIYRMHLEGSLQYVDGHFLNNQYFLESSEHPVGLVDDDGKFHYFQTDSDGNPAFPSGIGGFIEGLLLTRVDGFRFHICDLT